MSNGFSVESSALTAAAGRLDGIAAQVAAAAGPVPAAAGQAAAANPGYLTSPALVEVAGRLGASIQQLGQDVTGHAQGLRSNATAYDEAEQTNARMFRPGG